MAHSARPSLAWRLRNWLRWSFLAGFFNAWLSQKIAILTGNVAATSELAIRHIKSDGSIVDYGVDAAVVRDSTGVFHLDLQLSTAGRWFVRARHGRGQGGDAGL